MAYPYYQNTAPGWGTNQFQFGPPPAPTFQPQPSWGGLDYYRAHATSPDISLYNQAWNRVRNYGGDDYGGVGMHEARHWHRRAYGGLGQITQMLPCEIGHAAAYEAYRTWMHNSSIYEPLSGDIGRQREGLIGLAIAEATRLSQYAGMSGARYGRAEAPEAAAATASLIFQEVQGDEYGGMGVGGMGAGGMGYRGRSSSFGSGYSGSVDPYAYDDLSFGGRRRRRYSTSPLRSPIGPGPSSGYPYDSYGGSANAMPIPGTTSNALTIAGGGVGSSSYGQPGSYGSYGSYGANPMSMSMGGVGYAGSQSYGSVGGYGGYGNPGVAAPPGSVVIVSKPRKHRHRHHHHHGLRRSNSIDVVQAGAIPGYAGSYRY